MHSYKPIGLICLCIMRMYNLILLYFQGYYRTGHISMFGAIFVAVYPNTTIWKLATIKQETRNCHLYEKCGFVRTGAEHIVNEYMTLVEYEKRGENNDQD